MKRLLGLLIAANILIITANSGTLINLAHSSITEWSTSAGSNTSAVGTEGMSENAAPSTVNDSYREGLAQIARLARQAVLATFAPDGGTAGAYFITPALKPAAYISGQMFHVVPTSTNTGAATLNVGSLGAVTIKKASNSDLESGDMQAGSLYTLVYNGTIFQLLNPKGVVEANGITSSMIVNSAVTLSHIANATAGSLLTWNTFGTPAVITPGIIGQVLTSAGTNAVPVFQTQSTASIILGTALSMAPAAASTTATATHGLSGTPDSVNAALINTTADCGYAPGQIVNLPLNVSSAATEGATLIKGATQLQIVTGANFTYLVTWPGGTGCVATANRWNIWVTPYKFNL